MRTSPLDRSHRALGARMTEFGGWEMPLSYAEGTVAEHVACRLDAVVFDVSHLGTVRVEGPGALSLLRDTLTNDLARIAPGRAQYTHLLDDADGSVVDDLIVWWTAQESFDVMPNASNTATVIEALGGVDVTAERAVLAIQGPRARERLSTVWPQAASVGRFRVESLVYGGHNCHVAGTGYTGEDGLECAVPAAAAPQLWEALVGAGIRPAGLGARDTLRLEAGLPLHGHELGPGITPLQAGLEWVVRWDTPFRGRAPLEAERRTGPRRVLRGLVVDGRRPPRHGNPVLVDDDVVGSVTSGNFSPMLERGIGLAFLPPGTGDGTPVTVDVRGTAVAATVTTPPFWSGSA